MLTLSAAWATVLAVGDTAWAAAPEPARVTAAGPAPLPTPQSHLSYSDSSFMIDVFARPVQDLVAIRITVTNPSGPDNFKLSYLDNRTGKPSKVHDLPLGTGETQFMDLYGGLVRTFNVTVCRSSSGHCVTLGPSAPSSQ